MRRGSNLCLSLPRRNTPRRQRPQQNMTLLRRRKHSRNGSATEPEPDTEETRPARPPLYYFEEVEEKRAREREQLAAWYQPIPEPVKENVPVKPTVSVAPSIPPVERR